eukprot:4791-Heterococcus_DN1.PRE.4
MTTNTGTHPMFMKAVVCKDARAAGPTVQAAAAAAAAHMALLHCMSGTVCKKLQVVALTQGCSSASLALILAAGSTVSILRISNSERCDVSDAAAQTAAHTGTVSKQCSTAAAEGLLALVRACAHYTQLQCALIRPFYS